MEAEPVFLKSGCKGLSSMFILTPIMHNANRLNIIGLELMFKFCIPDSWTEKAEFVSRENLARSLYAKGDFNASAGHIR